MEDIKKMALQIVVRLRPTSEPGVVSTEKRIITINDPSRDHASEFVFDDVLGNSSSQEHVYMRVGEPLVDNVLKGYNACCFAYGQTGSGKTYSMFGKETGEWEERGLIPRAAEKLFHGAKELGSTGQVRFSFFVSLLEIYLEHVRDLGKASKALLPAPGQSSETPHSRPNSAKDDWYTRESLDIQEDTAGATVVKDLTYIEVKSVEDIMTVLKAGYSLRHTASTGQNDVSSRSHTVCTITVIQYPDDSSVGQPKTGRLNMVDLAGSERLKKSHSSDIRLQEAKAINTSLTALGKVVMNLSQEGDKGHVPFRDSKLTRILKESLNGSSYTTLLANVNPTVGNYEECFNTLQFALRCSSISTVPQVNIVTSGTAQDKVVEQLTFRVAQLTEEIEGVHAHYQKLIEEIGGPEYTHDMGPLERGGSGSFMSTAGSGGLYEDEGARDQKGVLGSGQGARTDSTSTRRVAKHVPSATISKFEAEIRLLQQQLDLQKKLYKDKDCKLKQTKHEFSDLQRRMVLTEQASRDNARSAKSNYKQLQEKMYDEGQALRTTIEELQNRLSAETTRLTDTNENLRSQLDSLAKSVGGLAEERSRQAKKAKEKGLKQQEEFESRYKMMTESISEENLRKLEIVKQQTSQKLKEKEEELQILRLDRDNLKTKCLGHISKMSHEVNYLLKYNESLWSIVQKIEKNEYSVRVINGLKSFRIPLKDKVECPMNSQSIHKIRRSCEKAQELLSFLEHDPTIPLPVEEGSIKREQTPTEGEPIDLAHSSSGYPTDQTELTQMQESQVADKSMDDQDGDTMHINALQRKVEELTGRLEYEESEERLNSIREELRTEIKGGVEEEVMLELQSHETVSYIRSLELSVKRYKETADLERKRSHDLLVSLRAAQRSAVPKSYRGPSNSTTKRPSSAFVPTGGGQSFRKILGLSSDRPQSAGSALTYPTIHHDTSHIQQSLSQVNAATRNPSSRDRR